MHHLSDAPAPPGSSDGTPRLVLQTHRSAAGSVVWESVFPAALWTTVLGDRPVTIDIQDLAPGARVQLLGIRGGRTTRLGPLPEGRRTLVPAELDHDLLWIEGAGHLATWSVPGSITLPPVAVVMPTYRREQDALDQSRRFLAMDAVATVILIDQAGTLQDHPGTRGVRREHGDRLRLITQENLGGSGGYARGMLEASAQAGSAILFSDDDAILGEESLRRMLTFQSLSARPTIVGTPLFSAAQPSRLLAHTETVHRGIFQWTAADRLRGSVDLAGTSPADWTFLDSDRDAGYTGWWGTLFPPGTARDLGLPAPLFLKWDDAEYGLRASAHGYRLAVLPGTSVHHPPWNAVRTQMTWTARVLHRNRLAVAAAYGAGRGVIASSLLHQIKHIVSGHLLTATLWQRGIEAFLDGPEAWMGNDLPRARQEGTRVVQEWTAAHRATSPLPSPRRRPLPLVPALLRSALRLVSTDRPPRVALELPADAVRWRTTLGADAVIITDGDGVEQERFLVTGSASRGALAATLRSHLRMARRWPALSRRYRRALPGHATAEAWGVVFGMQTAPVPDGEG